MNRKYKDIPLLAIRAESGTGKTTLLSKIIPLLRSGGVNLGCIKHTHHPLKLDTPGKDSYLLKKAGVNQMLAGDSQNWVLFGTSSNRKNSLEGLLEKFDYRELDLILIEGFKEEAIPNIVLQRGRFTEDISKLVNKNTIAIAGKNHQRSSFSLQYLNLDNPLEIATFIIDHVLKQ